MFALYKILFCGSWWRAKNALEFNIVDSNAHCILEKSVIAKSLLYQELSLTLLKDVKF